MRKEMMLLSVCLLVFSLVVPVSYAAIDVKIVPGWNFISIPCEWVIAD